jgi:hypothetical protein
VQIAAAPSCRIRGPFPSGSYFQEFSEKKQVVATQEQKRITKPNTVPWLNTGLRSERALTRFLRSRHLRGLLRGILRTLLSVQSVAPFFFGASLFLFALGRHGLKLSDELGREISFAFAHCLKPDLRLLFSTVGNTVGNLVNEDLFEFFAHVAENVFASELHIFFWQSNSATKGTSESRRGCYVLIVLWLLLERKRLQIKTRPKFI